ncbi:DODA-type extradiol aromatic ring-opening family dioxygenase [Streptomyces spongiae]|uniref:Extradiol ring-cleavage dioxygenase n=1 Tax=Streptomyces spongiae TaxID=565072 RepID=A0A5N8X9E3_9ACTN|nr:extradiol ring-cleavage dioxygenase [Streptomyces spongiae]MPY56052.1 extradiol ring-cleavage dioxygenase [Streptomyces spongiae]
MGSIVAVAGTSHSPMLGMEPEKMWSLRGEHDKANTELYDTDGVIRPYTEIAERAGDRYLAELKPEVWDRKFTQAQADIKRLAEDLVSLELDAVVVVGDDQDELFSHQNLPSIAVYHGEEMTTHHPVDMGLGQQIIEVQRRLGMDGETYPSDAVLGRHIIESLVDQGFDISSSDSTPPDTGFGHAFAWVAGRLLKGRTIPFVPILLNTYFPPNQPTPARCYDLGVALRQAVESAPGDARVGVVASGGLSHFVVDAELDHTLLDAMNDHDTTTLRGLPAHRMNSGTSELRNWITAAGAGSHLATKWVDYLPAYRTPAGTGVGLAFGLWA